METEEAVVKVEPGDPSSAEGCCGADGPLSADGCDPDEQNERDRCALLASSDDEDAGGEVRRTLRQRVADKPANGATDSGDGAVRTWPRRRRRGNRADGGEGKMTARSRRQRAGGIPAVSGSDSGDGKTAGLSEPDRVGDSDSTVAQSNLDNPDDLDSGDNKNATRSKSAEQVDNGAGSGDDKTAIPCKHSESADNNSDAGEDQATIRATRRGKPRGGRSSSEEDKAPARPARRKRTESGSSSAEDEMAARSSSASSGRSQRWGRRAGGGRRVGKRRWAPAGPPEASADCCVLLHRLPGAMVREAAKRGSVRITRRVTKRLSKEEMEMRRLTNIDALLRSSSAKNISADDSEDDDSDSARRKKPRRVQKRTTRSAAKPKASLRDMSSDGEDGAGSTAEESDAGRPPPLPLAENEFDRDQLMASGSASSSDDDVSSTSEDDDDSDFVPSESDRKSKTKNRKGQKEKGKDDKLKKKTKREDKSEDEGDDKLKSDEDEEDNKTDGEDESGSQAKDKSKDRKRLPTRVRKLLNGKLSATDSSEEDEKMRSKVLIKREKEAEKAQDKEGELDAKSEEEDNVPDELPKLLKLSSSEEDEVTENKRTPRKRRVMVLDDSDSDLCVLDSDAEDAAGPSSKKRARSSSSSSSPSSSAKSEDSADDFKPAKKTRSRARLKRIRRMSDESGSSEHSDDSVTEIKADSQGTPSKGGRKNIRHIRQAELSTKEASAAELARRKRIEEKQARYNELFQMESASSEPEALNKLILDFDPEKKKPLVSVHKNFVKILKPHQVDGVKFMFDCTVETVARLHDESNTDNSGCILAHCMGLGKTLQVVVLLHTLLDSAETRGKMACALVVCPKNTVQNWVRELKQWQKRCRVPEVDVIDITFRKDNYERSFELEEWRTEGGVCVLSYDMYKRFCGTGGKKGYVKKQKDRFQKALVDPGPDIVVCDEGHLLKNPRTAAFKSLHQMKCRRRVILTGTPLQNNLREYHTMVEFVKPRLLGSESEFSNRFIRPIENGSAVDAQPRDVRLMKRRSHVLHKLLDSVVQRRDYNVLTPFLPPKLEFTVLVRLSEVQRKLYTGYLATQARQASRRVLADFQALSRVWTHPRTIQMKDELDEIQDELKSEREAMERFVADDDASTSGEETAKDSGSGGDEKKEGEAEAGPPEPEWWRPCIPDGVELDDPSLSGKLTLLNDLLIKCENIGDKLLVFSQSLFSLNLIEEHLARLHREMQKRRNGPDKHPSHVYFGTWKPDYDYFRLDGSTPEDRRQLMCDRINKASNERARLMLISTKAGGLGINLVGANRVVIFDASWNPTADSQAIFRVYRFGQEKPCYVYRFIAQGCMEEKIYDRQITKLSLACRVVDEQQVERHFNQHDVEELYEFEPDRKRTAGLVVPKDDLMLMELASEQSQWVCSVHGHDSLLQNLVDEELNADEQRAAWEEYENDKRGVPNVGDTIPLIDGKAIDKATVIQMIKNDNPTATDNEVLLMIPKAIQTLRAYYFKKQQQERRAREEQYMRALEQQRQKMYGQAGKPSSVDMNTYNQMLQLLAKQWGGQPASSMSRQLLGQPSAAARQPAPGSVRGLAEAAAAFRADAARAGPSGAQLPGGVKLPKALQIRPTKDKAEDQDGHKDGKPTPPPAIVDIT
ncbi:transcriptional regulator ATRX homolog [Pollicipes pollicipes]|uniref:transcriptional regulator ATRX homolog n=1 Tax=Pollicipes pollicipes TaxID=41117 RepID=UPI00188539B3|nr:transcriptional regulator ATRX homolog [Pollicipes pollicipes]